MLPSGTVTFLFTDIQGSTQLLRKVPEHYPRLLRRHQELIEGAICDHAGVKVDAEGDRLFFAFSSARSALCGCVAAQDALLTERWPEDPMRVMHRVFAAIGVAP